MKKRDEPSYYFDYDQVCKWLGQGYTWRAIADKIGVSKSTCHTRYRRKQSGPVRMSSTARHRTGLPRKKPGPKPKGKPKAETSLVHVNAALASANGENFLQGMVKEVAEAAAAAGIMRLDIDLLNRRAHVTKGVTEVIAL